MPGPSISAATITIRGQVNRQVTTVLVDNVVIDLHADKTFTHSFIAPAHGLIQFTTRDTRGVSETRALQIDTTNQAAAPPMPTAAT